LGWQLGVRKLVDAANGQQDDDCGETSTHAGVACVSRRRGIIVNLSGMLKPLTSKMLYPRLAALPMNQQGGWSPMSLSVVESLLFSIT
jgi:hypothetical protein